VVVVIGRRGSRGRARPDDVNGARALIIVALPVAVAAIAMRALQAYAPAALDLQLSQPFPVLTDAGRFGATELSILVAALTTATIAYRFLLLRAPNRNAVTIGACALVLLALAWSVPIAFSSDVYAYAAYGEAALHGIDPFARLTLDPGDALFAAARVQWGASLPACVYGWGFVGAAASVVKLMAPLGAGGQIAGMRALSSLAMLACGVLAGFAVVGSRTERLFAAALVGCNPVAIWCAAEGHNDALAIAVALLGCVAAIRRPQLGAAIAGAAGAMKFPAILAALPASLRGRAWPGALLGAAVSIAASWPVVAHWSSGSNAHGGYAPHVSLQALLFAVLAPPLGRAAGAAAAVAVSVVAAMALGWNAIPDIRNGQGAGWIRLALAAWLLIPNPYPWYGLWLLAIATLAPRSREADAAIWLPVAALLRYAPDAAGLPPAPLELTLSAVALLPYAVLLPVRRSAIINRPL
jgi:hypothetical protein